MNSLNLSCQATGTSTEICVQLSEVLGPVYLLPQRSARDSGYEQVGSGLCTQCSCSYRCIRLPSVVRVTFR